MTSIELKDIKVHARHGLYAGESKTGSPYSINLTVTFEEGAGHINKLAQTVNYVKLYEIIKQRMAAPVALLETFAAEVIDQVKADFPFVNEIIISIYKLQAPIENFEGRVGVTIHKVFND